MQVDPLKYRGLLSSISIIVAEEGVRGIFKGFAPTAIGYSAQGFFKFGGYEAFKDLLSNLAGEEKAYKYRGWIYLASSASAELVACTALCPFEMMKVKIQTSWPGTFPTKMTLALPMMLTDKHSRFPFGSLVPLWSRQIPYTMMKFYLFEKFVEIFYEKLFTSPRDSYSHTTQLGVTFTSGFLSGAVCAIVSNPADTVISRMSQGRKTPRQILSELGITGVWKGLGVRMIMLGTVTGLQWFMYDFLKTAFGFHTSGGGFVMH